MHQSDREKTKQSRYLLQNPYAYSNDYGEFDAFTPKAHNNSRSLISQGRKLSQNPYALLNDKGQFDGEPTPNYGHIKIPNKILKQFIPQNKKRNYSSTQLENIATNLQKQIWAHREQLQIKNIESNPILLLNPSISINLIGYSFEIEETLGQFQQNGMNIEVAGTICNDKNKIKISRHFSASTRNFTAAHELGHAILHEETGLHRDRALTAIDSNSSRSQKEKEADKFATYFLMPKKHVLKVFIQLFHTDCFTLNEDTYFALGSRTSSKIKRNPNTLRVIARILASLESYNGMNFVSLAQQFGVSNEAMAIRIEELNLLNV